MLLLSTLPLVKDFAALRENGIRPTLYGSDTAIIVADGTGPSLVERWQLAESPLLARLSDPERHIRLKMSKAKAKLGRLRHLGRKQGSRGKVLKTYKSAIQPALAHAVAAWKQGLEFIMAKSALLQVTAWS